MMLGALLPVLLAGPVPSPAPPVPAPSLLGSGLLTLQDTRTLPRGRFTAGPTLYNRDRDPLGIDVFDYALAFNAGVTDRLEAFARTVFSRVVVVPDNHETWPALPPPPLDLVIPERMAPPPRPYYAIAPPFPFANGRGDQRFSDLVPGDMVLGFKLRVRDVTETRSGFAVGASVTVPLTERMGALQSGSGTGGIDVSLRGIAERRFLGMDVVTSATITRVGGAHYDDRVLRANPEDSDLEVHPLRLPSRIEIGAGLRRALTPRIAVVGEGVATIEVFGAKTLDRISPLDFLAGVQAHAGPARLSAGLLYAGGSPPSGDVRPSPLAGMVDLSRASTADARRYLELGGMGGADRYLRPGAQLVTARVAGAPLPTGARIIPETYTIISEHQIGLVCVLGWAF